MDRNALICGHLQMRLRLPAFCFVMLSLLLLWYVKPFSCASTVYTWFGMLPAQIAATAAVVLISFIGTPTSSTGTLPILQAGHLQDFLLSPRPFRVYGLGFRVWVPSMPNAKNIR